MKKFPKLGATGQFPQGKLDKTDEGELQLAVTVANGCVHIAFGKAVAWLAMSPDEARGFAQIILRQAARAVDSED